MTKKRNSRKASSEIDLEVDLTDLIRTVLPGVGIGHQLEFTLQLGHKMIPKCAKISYARGRADILVTFDDKPLAIFELKKPGLGLTDKDVDQGLSYARLLHPQMAPLVVVTDGVETRFRETFSGKPWLPTTITEQVFKQLSTFA